MITRRSFLKTSGKVLALLGFVSVAPTSALALAKPTKTVTKGPTCDKCSKRKWYDIRVDKYFCVACDMGKNTEPWDRYCEQDESGYLSPILNGMQAGDIVTVEGIQEPLVVTHSNEFRQIVRRVGNGNYHMTAEQVVDDLAARSRRRAQAK